MNQIVYLAGPMSGLTYDQANDWRATAAEIAPYWIDTVSPLRGKSYLKTGNPLQDHDNDSILCTQKAINARDYNDVKRSAAILVNLLGAEKVSIGTVMEIAWAKAMDVPCVLVIENGNIHEHAMINASCGFICSTLEEGMKTIAAITGNDDQVEDYMEEFSEDCENEGDCEEEIPSKDYFKELMEEIERIRVDRTKEQRPETYEEKYVAEAMAVNAADLKQRNIDINIKAPAPKEDRVLSAGELLYAMLYAGVIKK